MAADIYTNSFLDPEKLELAILLISVMDDSKIDATIRHHLLVFAEKAAKFETKAPDAIADNDEANPAATASPTLTGCTRVTTSPEGASWIEKEFTSW